MKLHRLWNTSLALLLGVLFTLLSGCATSPYDVKNKAPSDQFLLQQIEQAEQALSGSTRPRLIFAGFAMNSQSKAFRGDVELAERRVRSVDSEAVVFKLSNPVLGQAADWPYATRENMIRVFEAIAKYARPQDKVILLLSTHGNVNLLSINAAQKEYAAWTGEQLRQTLNGLAKQPVWIIVSACHAGSLIPALSQPNWLISAAAAKDRISFGCQFNGKQTYFVDGLLGDGWSTEASMQNLFARAKLRVAERERAERLSPPSSPQLFVGESARELADKPLSKWRD